FESEDELKSRLSDGLKKYTPSTITERPALVQQLRAVTEKGYAVDTGEYVEDVRSIAAPIKDYTGRVVGALAVSGPAYRLTNDRLQKEMAPLVVKAGAELSSRLGHNA